MINRNLHAGVKREETEEESDHLVDDSCSGVHKSKESGDESDSDSDDECDKHVSPNVFMEGDTDATPLATNQDPSSWSSYRLATVQVSHYCRQSFAMDFGAGNGQTSWRMLFVSFSKTWK